MDVSFLINSETDADAQTSDNLLITNYSIINYYFCAPSSKVIHSLQLFIPRTCHVTFETLEQRMELMVADARKMHHFN